MLISKTRGLSEKPWYLEVSHRLKVDLRHFHISTLFRFFLTTRRHTHSRCKAFDGFNKADRQLFSFRDFVYRGFGGSHFNLSLRGFQCKALPNIFNGYPTTAIDR